MKIPITVLMPVYNSEKYLESAIMSILNQSFDDFEFLIINDGSTDKSDQIIKSYSDKRIKYISNHKNISLSKTLKKGVSLSRGIFIARMDSDDISHRKRLEEQYLLFKRQSSLDLVGTNIRYINNNGKVIGYPNIIDNPLEIKWKMFFRNCFSHPTVMFKKASLEKYNLNYGTYSSKLKNYFEKGVLGIGDEDYLLFGQVTVDGEVANINKVFLDYRIHKNSLTSIYGKEQTAQSKIISHYLVNYWLSKNKNINYSHSRDQLRKIYKKFVFQQHNSDMIKYIHDFYAIEILNYEKKISMIFRIFNSIKLLFKLNNKNKQNIKYLIKYIVARNKQTSKKILNFRA